MVSHVQYGETPLHLAAKNGCTEAMKLLLQHGAYIEARANVSILSAPAHAAALSSLLCLMSGCMCGFEL